MQDNAIQTLLEQRASTGRYDASRGLPEADIHELIRLATLAPSAYHAQNWHFIAARSPQAKARLLPICHGQRQVLEAAVTFIVCGTLALHEGLPEILRASVEAGIVPQGTSDTWVAMARRDHEGNARLQRDEAIRSASLAAMTLMLAAQGRGLASGAMGGFDAAGLSDAFGLTARDLPVLLVTVGHAAPGNWPQKPRRSLREVAELV
jgi:nitroreductase